MDRTLGNFIKIKGNGNITQEQKNLFRVLEFDKGWLKRYSSNEVSEKDWNKAILSLHKSKGKFSKKQRTVGKDEQQLYLMKSESGLYKIGISKNVEDRRSAIKSSSGFKTDVLCVWKTPVTAFILEQTILRVFGKYRKQGEWFLFPDGTDGEKLILDYIRTHHPDCLPIVRRT